MEQFGRAQGLVNLGVKSVLVDSDRNLWVGTQLGGLLQFGNGRFFPAIGSEPISPNHEFEISALYQDRSNRLWAGTQAGLAAGLTNSWNFVPDELTGEAVRAILQDRSGDLWVGTQGSGLKRIHEGKTISYGKAQGLPSDNISCLFEDGSSVLCAGTPVGLARFINGRWISYAGHFSEPSGNVGYLIEDDQGYLWIGASTGLMRARRADLSPATSASILALSSGGK